jgi:transposase InsO family protein
MDFYSRKIIGWSMGNSMGRQMAMNALEMAVAARNKNVTQKLTSALAKRSILHLHMHNVSYK